MDFSGHSCHKALLEKGPRDHKRWQRRLYQSVAIDNLMTYKRDLHHVRVAFVVDDAEFLRDYQRQR